VTPTLTRSILTISGTPTDTFLNAGEFGTGNRGVVFVNGFNIGRFSVIGPTKTMYIPAPLLQSGRNTVSYSFPYYSFILKDKNSVSFSNILDRCFRSVFPRDGHYLQQHAQLGINMIKI